MAPSQATVYSVNQLANLRCSVDPQIMSSTSFANDSNSFLLSYRCSTKRLLRKKCLISHSCTYLTLDSSRVALRNICWHSQRNSSRFVVDSPMVLDVPYAAESDECSVCVGSLLRTVFGQYFGRKLDHWLRSKLRRENCS